MIRYIYIFLALIFFSCKKHKESVSTIKDSAITKKHTTSEEKPVVEKRFDNNIDLSFVENLEPIDLPIGNEILKDFDFPTSWNFGDPYDSDREISSIEKQILSFTGYVTYMPSKTVKKYQSQINNFYKQNDDYRFLLFDFDQYNRYDITRYTDLNDSIKILTIGYNKENIMPTKEFPVDVSYRDFLTIKNDKVYSILNIDNFMGNSTLGGHYRKCYIDSSYIIHIKDFDFGENQGYFIRYEKWKIKDNGHIVRYYSQKDTLINQGTIKNHVREGNWTEIYPDANLASRKKIFNIEHILSHSKGNYSKGEKIGLWEYYANVELKEGVLLYTETYRNGEMVKREFMKEAE